MDGNDNMNDMIGRFTGFGIATGLDTREGEDEQGAFPAHPADLSLTANIDQNRIVFGMYRASNGWMYHAAGYPKYVPPSVGDENPSTLPPLYVDLPLHEPNLPLPQVGTTAIGYTIIHGWIYTAIGRVVGVTPYPEPVVWVHPVRGQPGHRTLPYQSAEMPVCHPPSAWNWSHRDHKQKPLPALGSQAPGVWRSPEGGCFVGVGKVIKVENGPPRGVWVEPIETSE
ncbi:hypothetical protein BJY01DRAFT_252999 [Aspergillus pseudoustus]|uniref:Uncharacterized protein n=1 Tax=Aspergillus pseudoustus TaxID=1810923 RepID=A0ABR4J3P6_9EURO